MIKQRMYIVLAVFCLAAGCILGKNLKANNTVQQEYCFLCGSNSMMAYYEESDSVGIIHWNSGTIVDTEAGEYGDDSEEFSGHGVSTNVRSFGEPYGSLVISVMPGTGNAEVTVHYEDADEADPDALEEKLCRECLEQVTEFYENQKEQVEDICIAATGYCLIDFQTKQLYTLSEPYSMYFIRDYHVSYEIKEDNSVAGSRIKIQIFYAPERDSLT